MRFNGYPLIPVITYNQTQAERILNDIAATFVNRPVIDATLTIRDGTAVAPPAQTGRSVDITSTLSVLRKEIVGLSEHSEITLAVNETPPTIWDASAAAERVNLALSTPIEFFMAPGDELRRGRGSRKSRLWKKCWRSSRSVTTMYSQLRGWGVPG